MAVVMMIVIITVVVVVYLVMLILIVVVRWLVIALGEYGGAAGRADPRADDGAGTSTQFCANNTSYRTADRGVLMQFIG